MQANKFVKEHGWDEAKKLIALDGWKNTPFLVRVKRLVESKAWVAEHGTIERAKEYANSPYTAPEIKERLLQAIADVESCQPDLPESVVQSLREVS